MRLKAILARAFSDTVRPLGGPPGIAFLLGGPAAGLFFLDLIAGKDTMTGELSYFWAGLAGSTAVVAILFCYNLIAAPYRIERDRANAAERELATLAAVKSDPDLPFGFDEFLTSAQLAPIPLAPNKVYFGFPTPMRVAPSVSIRKGPSNWTVDKIENRAVIVRSLDQAAVDPFSVSAIFDAMTPMTIARCMHRFGYSKGTEGDMLSHLGDEMLKGQEGIKRLRERAKEGPP